jgi:uncharacterized protein
MIYLDTSVAVSLLVSEPKTANVKTWFVALSGIAVSSDWLISEFSSAIAIKQRARELSESDARSIRKEFRNLMEGGLRILPVSRTAFHKAAELSIQHKNGLRAGDALHLAVALEIGAKSIATLDSVMAVNAERLKIRVETI